MSKNRFMANNNEIKVNEDDEAVNIQQPASSHDQYDEGETRFTFNPPLYIQRYDYVTEILKKFKCTKFMDIGCAECKLLRFIKNSNENLNLIVGVDLRNETLQNVKHHFSESIFDYVYQRKKPLDLLVNCS